MRGRTGRSSWLARSRSSGRVISAAAGAVASSRAAAAAPCTRNSAASPGSTAKVPVPAEIFATSWSSRSSSGSSAITVSSATAPNTCCTMKPPSRMRTVSSSARGSFVATHQPATLAAMEGLFRTEAGAPLVILGQPDVEQQRLDNPLVIPRMLSFLTYRRWRAEVKGLDAYPREDWPDNIPLLYYSYHIMVGLGTIFIAVMGLAAWMLWRGMLWTLMLSLPFPYIANTAGWITAEVGRQPWLVHGLLRTAEGASPLVSSGNPLFTLLGFMGMYWILGLLCLFLRQREIARGPEA